jgi:DNA repair/transcription protein MET18/MMS19
MYSSDASIEAAALSALEALVRTLYPDVSDPPAGLAQDIIKQSVELLNEPEKTQATSATKMLAALLRSSRTCLHLTRLSSRELTRSCRRRIRLFPSFTTALPAIQ